MTHEEPTIEEKIDYIYNRMRKQQKVELFAVVVKWGTRVFIVLSIAYFFFVKLPILKDDIIDGLKPDIPTFNSEDISNSDFLNSLKERFLWDDTEEASSNESQSNTEINY